MSGLTDTGFETKTLDDIQTDLQTAFQAAFGNSIDLSANEPFGQVIGIMSERFSELWELGQSLYTAATPDGATGVSLDEVCALTGTVRLAAKSSTVTVTATGTPTTVLALGRILTVAITGTRFQTTAAGTITLLTSWANTTAYVVGNRRTNASRCYVCITSGTSAGSGGPTTTASDITDGSVHWRYIGEGTGAIDIAAQSIDTGAKVALSGTLTGIGSPQSGWSSVTNLLDAVLGRDLENDSALRLRREVELRADGRAAVEAIRAIVLEVANVTACTVFENVTDSTDGDGLPPHSVECLVRDGADADISAAIFESVAAGIATHGGVSNSVTDSQGIVHTVSFSRPTEKDIWVIVNVTVDATLFPSDGATQIQEAITAYGAQQSTGKDAVSAALVAQTFRVAGVLDATALIGLSNPPVATTTVAIALRELAFYDTGRIAVNVTPGTP